MINIEAGLSAKLYKDKTAEYLKGLKEVDVKGEHRDTLLHGTSIEVIRKLLSGGVVEGRSFQEENVDGFSPQKGDLYVTKASDSEGFNEATFYAGIIARHHAVMPGLGLNLKNRDFSVGARDMLERPVSGYYELPRNKDTIPVLEYLEAKNISPEDIMRIINGSFKYKGVLMALDPRLKEDPTFREGDGDNDYRISLERGLRVGDIVALSILGEEDKKLFDILTS